MQYEYEKDPQAFPADTYRERGGLAIAWRVFGWEIQPEEETEGAGSKQRTGRVVAVMVGDDRPFLFDPEDLEALPEGTWCVECGQIGCTVDGRERD